MNTKQCFTCKNYKILEDFQLDRRKYQVPADRGRCKVCIICEYQKALRTMEMFYFSKEANDYVTIKFESQQDIVKAFKAKLDYETQARIFVTQENGGGYMWDI